MYKYFLSPDRLPSQKSFLSANIKSKIVRALKYPSFVLGVVGRERVYYFGEISLRSTKSGGLNIEGRWDEKCAWTTLSNSITLYRRPGYSDRSIGNVSIELAKFFKDVRRKAAILNPLYGNIERRTEGYKQMLYDLVIESGIEDCYDEMTEEDTLKIKSIIKTLGE